MDELTELRNEVALLRQRVKTLEIRAGLRVPDYDKEAHNPDASWRLKPYQFGRTQDAPHRSKR